MFCLRSWVPLLIFLTNASPIYVLLFLTATYILQRPCVYCSILLFVLVSSLFDFNADWFEPRWSGSATSFPETATSYLSGNTTLTDAVLQTASLAASAINGTGGSLASAAMEGVKRHIAEGANAAGAGASAAASVASTNSGYELLRSVLDKRQFRIPCLDVIVRL